MLTESTKDVLAFVAVILGSGILWWICVFVAFTVTFFQVRQFHCDEDQDVCYLMHRASLKNLEY